MATSSYNLAPGESADSAALRRKRAQALMETGADTSPVLHPLQGLARALQAGIGGYELYQEDQKDDAEKKQGRELMAKLLAGDGAGSASAPLSLTPPSQGPSQPSPAPQAPRTGPIADVPLGSSRAADDVSGATEPRGIRNGNPLNIEDGQFARSQPGYAGSDGRFAKFASLDNGTAAASSLLDVYDRKHGLNTVGGIVGRWAPAGDGNNVSAYADTVSKKLGVAPDTPLTPEMRQKLVAAMAEYENGKPLPQTQTAALPPPANMPTVDPAARTAPMPTVAPSANTVPMPTVGAQGSPTSPAVSPSLAPPAQPPMPGVNRDALAAMLSNKYTAPMAQQVLSQLLSQQFKPAEFGFSTLPDGTVVRQNPRTGQVEPVYQGAGKNTDDIREFEYAQKQGFKGSLEDWMARKRGGAGEYGLNPVWGVGPDGKPAIIQLGKTGTAVQSKMPDGFQVAKDPIKMDAGTHFVILDPQTRQPIATVPKNVAEAAAQKEIGEEQGKARINLPDTLAKTQQSLDLIDEMIKHPGRETATGMSRWLDPRNYLAGTDAANFATRQKQIEGRAFLEAFNSLRGGGAITEVEGAKATQAIARLDRSQSDEEYLSALKELHGIMKLGMDRAKVRAGTPPGGYATTAPAAMIPGADGWSDAGGGVRIRIKPPVPAQ